MISLLENSRPMSLDAITCKPIPTASPTPMWPMSNPSMMRNPVAGRLPAKGVKQRELAAGIRPALRCAATAGVHTAGERVARCKWQGDLPVAKGAEPTQASRTRAGETCVLWAKHFCTCLCVCVCLRVFASAPPREAGSPLTVAASPQQLRPNRVSFVGVLVVMKQFRGLVRLCAEKKAQDTGDGVGNLDIGFT